MCNNQQECNNRGDCKNQVCNCYIGWFNEQAKYCTQNLSKLYPQGFYIYQSPYNLAMILLILISTIEILWIFIDPYEINNIMTRIPERMIQEFIYSLLFTVFGIILVVWYSIFEELVLTHYDRNSIKNTLKSYVFKFFKCLVKLRIITVYLVQISTSILKGYPYNSETEYLIVSGYSYLAFNFILFIGEYTLYGILVYKQLKNYSDQYDKDINEQNKATKTTERKNKFNRKIKINNNTTKLCIKLGETSETNLVYKKSQNDQDQIQQNQPNQNIISNIDLNNNNKDRLKSSSINSNSNNNENLFKFDIKLDETHFKKIEGYSWKPLEKSKEYIKQQQENFLLLKNNIKKQLFMEQSLKTKQQNFFREYQQNTYGLSQQTIQQTNQEKNIKFQIKQSNLSIQQDQKSHLTQEDEKILKQILLIIILGIIFQLLFLALSFSIIFLDILSNALNTMLIIISLELLKSLSCIAIIRLFTNINSQTKDTLRWISRVGSIKNRINQSYRLQFPEYLLKDNRNKQILQDRINYQS